MQNRVISGLFEAVDFVRKHKPLENILFTRPSGQTVATWMSWSEGGELYTEASLRRYLPPYFVFKTKREV